MSVIQQPAGLDEQALIAEARALTRRRRRKIALVLVIALITASAGVLIAKVTAGTRHAAQARPRTSLLMTRTGILTGHLSACFGLDPVNRPPPVTPGTVVVLRGSLTTRPDGPGRWQLVFSKGPVLAHQYISDNYTQVFRFALPPGHYVLAGSYGGPGYSAFQDVTVAVGKIMRVDLRNACK